MSQVKKFFSELDGDTTARIRHHVRATLGETGAKFLEAVDADVGEQAKAKKPKAEKPEESSEE